MSRTTVLSATLAAAAVLTLGAACGTPQSPTAASTTAPTTTSVRAQALTLVDGWAKAGTGMTGAFGTLTNTTGAPVTLTGGTSPAAARVELHTMAKQPDGTMKMVKKEGGFVLAAGAKLTLEPGGDHIMLIGLTKELRNGDRVDLTLTSSTGESYPISVPVRSFSGAGETYLPAAPSTGSGS